MYGGLQDQLPRPHRRHLPRPGKDVPCLTDRPDNIERLQTKDGSDHLKITLAVAGFSEDELDIAVEENQLTIRGKQTDNGSEGQYLHRGIAARQFQRTFVLADGVEVSGANLENGLLAVDLMRKVPEQIVRKIKISTPAS